MLETKKDEYYHYGEKYKLLKKVVLNNVEHGICSQTDSSGDYDYTDYFIFKMSDLKKWEDTYQYSVQKEIKDKTDQLKADQEKVVAEIRKKALDSLVMRLSLNSVFAKDKQISEVGMAIVNELKGILDGIDLTKKR